MPKSRQVIFEVRDFDVLPDGRFITAIPVSEQNAPLTPEAPEIQVVLNWTEELKRLVPRN